MAILPIVTGQNTPMLRKKTAQVAKVTKELKKLISDMDDTVHDAKGAGIAAPQIGQSLRLCIALIGKRFVPLINPVITWKSEETDIVEEGCLSLPDTPWRSIERSVSIIVKYQDPNGEEKERKLEMMDARVVQHEVDHLEGILIVDYEDKMPEKSMN